MKLEAFVGQAVVRANQAAAAVTDTSSTSSENNYNKSSSSSSSSSSIPPLSMDVDHIIQSLASNDYLHHAQLLAMAYRRHHTYLRLLLCPHQYTPAIRDQQQQDPGTAPNNHHHSHNHSHNRSQHNRECSRQSSIHTTPNPTKALSYLSGLFAALIADTVSSNTTTKTTASSSSGSRNVTATVWNNNNTTTTTAANNNNNNNTSSPPLPSTTFQQRQDKCFRLLTDALLLHGRALLQALPGAPPVVALYITPTMHRFC